MRLAILLLFAFMLSGCASSGHFIRSQHNGKVYWLPPECKGQYQEVPNSDNIRCSARAGEIAPTPPAEYEAYLKEREYKDARLNAPLWVDPYWAWGPPRYYYYGPRILIAPPLHHRLRPHKRW